MRGRPPAKEMEQIVGITSQRGIGHATDSLLVQKSIDPLHFPAGMLDHAKRAVRESLRSVMTPSRRMKARMLKSLSTDTPAIVPASLIAMAAPDTSPSSTPRSSMPASLLHTKGWKAWSPGRIRRPHHLARVVET